MNLSRARTPRISWLITLAALALASPAVAVTADDFLLRSGADVVALCSAPSGDPLYVAAVHMCQGFGTGTYQTIIAMTRHDKIAPLVCQPDPPVSRNEAIRQFLDWASQNPRYLREPAVEVVGRFLVTRYPCPER
jgi:hypothetical protein